MSIKATALKILRKTTEVNILSIHTSRRKRGRNWVYSTVANPPVPAGTFSVRYIDDMVEVTFHRHGFLGQDGHAGHWKFWPGMSLMGGIHTV